MATRFGILGAGGISRRFASVLKECGCADLSAVARAGPGPRGGLRAGIRRERCLRRTMTPCWPTPRWTRSTSGSRTTCTRDLVRRALLAARPSCAKSRCRLRGGRAGPCGPCARKDLLLMEGMWTRCMPAVRRATQWVQKGVIGPVRLLRAAFCFDAPFDPAVPPVQSGPVRRRAAGRGRLPHRVRDGGPGASTRWRRPASSSRRRRAWTRWTCSPCAPLRRDGGAELQHLARAADRRGDPGRARLHRGAGLPALHALRALRQPRRLRRHLHRGRGGRLCLRNRALLRAVRIRREGKPPRPPRGHHRLRRGSSTRSCAAEAGAPPTPPTRAKQGGRRIAPAAAPFFIL